MKLEIAEEHLAAFLACVGIGTLHAIRSGHLPANAGTWSLAAPAFWEPLEAAAAVPAEIIGVFQSCDELSALRQLAPEAFDSELEQLIERLAVQLRASKDPIWRARWEGGPSEAPETGT